MLNIHKYRSVSTIILTAVFSLIVAACGESSDPADQSTPLPVSESPPALKLSQNTVDTKSGATFTLDIELDRFPVTEGGGVDIGYSPGILQVRSIAINNKTWDFVNQQGNIDNSQGKVTNVLVSSYQGVEDSAVIATITFEAISPGKSAITLSESTINPFASAGTKVNPLFISSNVTVR